MNRLLEWMGPIWWLVRPLAMTAMWLTASGFFGMAYFLSARSVRVEEAIVFTVAFGTAAAVSAVVAMAVGAKRRWAMEAALPMAILIAVPIGTAEAIIWLAPTMNVKLRTASYFARYGGRIPVAIIEVSRETIPMGAILGAGIGLIGGLSIVLCRRFPRLVGWFLVVLLVSCVIGSVHITAFDRVVDFEMNGGLEGVHRLLVPWGSGAELPTAIGAAAGAFVGAVAACWAVHIRSRGRPQSPMEVSVSRLMSDSKA
jgi:hypothetical protein